MKMYSNHTKRRLGREILRIGRGMWRLVRDNLIPVAGLVVATLGLWKIW